MTTTSSFAEPVKKGNFDADGQIYLNIGGAKAGVPFNTIYATGNFGGGTLKAQVTPDGTNWLDVEYATLTATGYINLQMKFLGCRLDLSGSISPDLDIWGI